ncbi:MAG: glutaredoxin family protein [bacterium]|nr:glutaredoxin family protein [bacterium]
MKSLPLILFALAATAALVWEKGGVREWSDENAPRAQLAAQAEPTAAKVTLYTMVGCPYCRAAVSYLDDIGQPYVNRDVQQDPDAYAEYMRKTGGNPGVPVIDVNGQIMQGWDSRQFESMLVSNR